MKKKFMSMMLAGLLIFCLSACGETISKYKSNDADNYFMQEHTEGGTKDIGGAYLEKISFTRLLGPEKLILTVKNDDKAVKEMPFFTVDVTEDGTLISALFTDANYPMRKTTPGRRQLRRVIHGHRIRRKHIPANKAQRERQNKHLQQRSRKARLQL
jgi:hypothetical protein